MKPTINEILNSNVFTKSLKRLGLIKDVGRALKDSKEEAIKQIRHHQQRVKNLEEQLALRKSELASAEKQVSSLKEASKKARRLEDERKQIVAELYLLRPLLDAINLLASGPDLQQSCISYVDKLMTHKRGGVAYSFAFGLRDQLNEELGNLCLLAIANRRRLSKLALQLSTSLEVEALAKYGIHGACFALAAGTPEEQGKLLEVLRFFAKHDGFGHSWAEFELAMRTALAMRQTELYTMLRESAARVGVMEKAPSYRLREFDAAAHRIEMTSRASLQTQTSAEIQFGLLSYKNVDYSSFNIGDYIQSLAVNNFLASLEYNSNISGDSADVISYLKTQQKQVAVTASVDLPVNFREIQRDWMSLAAHEAGPIWHVSYGWHMHRQGLASYDFPPPDNLRPILISVHIARPDVLTDRAIAYYKKYEPVGCRDWNSVRLFKSHGVQAFFSGCVTTMLGHYYNAPSAASKRVYADYLASKKTAKQLGDRTPIDHTQYELIYESYLENVTRAHELMKFYEQGCDVETPLLHAYLPNRAIGNKVSFSHTKLADPRFEGLIGIEDTEIVKMANGIRSKLSTMLQFIGSGAAEADVYAKWNEICAADVAKAEDYLDHATHMRAYEAYKKWPMHIQVEPSIYKAGAPVPRKWEPVKSAESEVHLAFCFDRAFRHFTEVTMVNACEQTSGSIVLHAFGRDITEQDVAEISASIPEAKVYFYDMSKVDYGSVTLLGHISISTMDRLLIPELIADAERVVYLDADIYVRSDLRELYDIDLGDNAIAARSSIHDEWKSGYNLILNIANRFDEKKAAKFRSEFYAGGDIHFDAYNAGVMVMDIVRLRAARFSNMMIAMVKEYGFHDQIAVNVFTRGQRTELDVKWNHFPSQEVLEDPAIVHYVGTAKPWDTLYQRYTADWKAVESRLAAQKASLKSEDEPDELALPAAMTFN